MSGKQAVLRIPEGTPEIKEIVIRPEVVVAGDHPAALVMSDYLASMGVSVILIIPTENMDGCLVPMKPLMTVDEDIRGAYGLLPERVEKNPKITVFPQAHLVDISGWWGNFTVRLISNGEEREIQASGVALAYRMLPEISKQSDEEGRASFTEFLAGLDLEKGVWNAKPIKRVAFVLDADKRDEKWASGIAVRVGLYLKKRFKTECYILCQDLKASLDDMEGDYRRARESGILFFKFRDLPRFYRSEWGGRLEFEDTSAISPAGPSNVTLEELDLVVWQEHLILGEDLITILNHMKIPIEEGTVGPLNPQFIGRTPKMGVVVGGDAWFPEYPMDAVMTALAAAEELYQRVGLGTYAIDIDRVAEVDPSKCATCLTCFRICPHDSIRIERYGERNVYITKGAKEGSTWEAARVKVETCNGCGLCASECPAKAIQLIYYPDIEVMEFLEGNL